MNWIATLHVAATLVMVGLIWFVQVVHYPLFAAAGGEGFAAFHAEHLRRTGPVVGPPMIVEAATALALAVTPPLGAGRWAGAGLVLLAVIWISTALVQVPLHRRLARGFDAATARRLVLTNWVRTAAWTARGGVALKIFVLAS